MLKICDIVRVNCHNEDFTYFLRNADSEHLLEEFKESDIFVVSEIRDAEHRFRDVVLFTSRCNCVLFHCDFSEDDSRLVRI